MDLNSYYDDALDLGSSLQFTLQTSYRAEERTFAAEKTT